MVFSHRLAEPPPNMSQPHSWCVHIAWNYGENVLATSESSREEHLMTLWFYFCWATGDEILRVAQLVTYGLLMTRMNMAEHEHFTQYKRINHHITYFAIDWRCNHLLASTVSVARKREPHHWRAVSLSPGPWRRLQNASHPLGPATTVGFCRSKILSCPKTKQGFRFFCLTT